MMIGRSASGRIRPFLALMTSVLIACCSSEEGTETPVAVEQPDTRVETVTDSPGHPSQTQPGAQMDRGRSDSVGPDTPMADNAVDQLPGASAFDLIEDLRSLDWSKGSESDPRAEQLLLHLRRQGADALGPIRDYLLDREKSGTVSPELRQALLDVLLGLGLPEVEGVVLELLSDRPGAIEVWQIGRYLQRVQPGVFADSIRLAAEQALIDSDTATFLPAEFFQFLGELGNDQTALLLSSMPMHQQAYGSLGLAQIPDGSGVPLLAQDARAFEEGRDTAEGRLALQLLAQQSPRFPEAAAALIELAEQGVIPQDLWPYVLDLVAGNWELTLIAPAPGDQVGSHTYYHPEGDQVIFRALPHPGAVDDGLQQQRLFLLDRLLPLAPPELNVNSGG